MGLARIKRKCLKLSSEQRAVLQRVIGERFGDGEQLAKGLEDAARKRKYTSPHLFAVNYRRHCLDMPVTMRHAWVYLDVSEEDSQLDFLRPLVSGR
ncbi:MAG: hypothetical protein KKD18_06360 [Nanoarchaeota archaeon]|nr:hypothetical protein [Nanoarchaeota archaeon]MBU0978016.1 hypothetical protein [Nanoarchaeota archaeon]